MLKIGIRVGIAAVVFHTGMLAAQSKTTDGWIFRSEPQADLWFHGLAVVGYDGFGPLPLYNRRYQADVEAARGAVRTGSTVLDSLRPRLRAAFASDSQFEFLHFVPVYFSGGTAEGLIEVVRAASDGRDPDPVILGDASGGRFLTEVLRTVLGSGPQKRTMNEFADVLDHEMSVGLSHGSDDMHRVTDNARQWWQRNLAGALAPFMRSMGLEGGVVLVSPALGPEGRVFRGRATDATDNVVAVGVLDGEPRDISFSLVREACYPVVTELVRELGHGRGDRYSAERISSRGAVRCGAMVLDQYAPQHAGAYRLRWVRLAVNDVPGTAHNFDDVFPVPDDLLSALETRLRELDE